ncbi:NADPH-dependent ferric siderophore reductase [Kineosphaera limosa]|uniref:Putative siderophore-interacting protein n=1 Tax=Kineosphaera limosa NBRC 100340 TaxID=1184609 RepID=K6WBW9_9MICO|nr:siderophore-interacting protein [Kineosphaera limosa]NYE01827.1 NADPH-dependent ferric siderophore reductase [Kineosphaera limosa]GAB96730.1 putative siderophore-interacting protein [Kineosphaera limosa NBRC 100340]
MAIRDSRRRRGPARCTVTAVSRPTPRMVRVQLRGDDLVGVMATGPDQRVKLAFPTGRTFGDDQAEAGAARRRRRTYTLLDLDSENGTAAVEFVVHGGGLAGDWAEQALPGDEVDVTGPVGTYEIDREAAGHLLICDETGIPAARAIVAELLEVGATDLRVYVEVADEAERVPLPIREVTWLPRGDRRPGEPMAALADDLTCPADTQVWIAGEAAAVRTLRTHLVAGLGLDRRRVSAVAYWAAGHAEGDPAAGRPGEHA